MSEKSTPYQANDGDVIQFGDSLLYRVGKFTDAIDRVFETALGDSLSQQLDAQGFSISEDSLVGREWTDEGIDVQILSLGSHKWQSGRVKLKLCFELIDNSVPLEPIDLGFSSGDLAELDLIPSSHAFTAVESGSQN
jgi:KGK domain